MAYTGVYVAKSVEIINKYNPGKCKFAIPQLMDADGSELPSTSKIPNSKITWLIEISLALIQLILKYLLISR